MVAILLGGCIAIGLICFVARRSRSRSEDSRARLVRLCHGDTERAERLIALESTKSPGISRTVAVSRAIHAFRRDSH